MRDWMTIAAEEIASCSLLTPEGVRQIIARRCPLLLDVAYMPVPRCETCAYWDRDDITIEDTAECQLPTMTAIVTTKTADEVTFLTFKMRTKRDFGCVQWEAK